MKKLKRYLLSICATTLCALAAIVPVSATVVSASGGTWNYGVNETVVWSNYYHASKVHKSSVIGYTTHSSAWTSPKYWSYSSASKSGFTNKAYYDIR